jgi:fructose-bisphosphate aldolase class II
MDTVMKGSKIDDDVQAVIERIELGVKEVVGTLIVEFGSVGKASLVELLTTEDMIKRYKK